MKSYKLQTIQSIRVIVKDYISKPGIVNTTHAIRILEAHSFGFCKSSLRNIFSMIMNDMVKVGRAEKSHRGHWRIIEQNDPTDIPLGSGGIAPKFVKEALLPAPVSFDPRLTAFLDPPKCQKHVDVYNELKKIKDKSRFMERAILACDKAGIPITRLIKYINEQQEARHIQRA